MTNWRVWAGILVSVASIVLVLRQVDLTEVAQQVARSDPGWLLALVVSVPITLWLKAARWRLFFHSSDGVTTPKLLSAMFIGYMVSVFAPLRAGELVRVFLVANGERLSWSRVLATVVVEKVLDVLAVALFLVGLALVVPLPGWALDSAKLAGLVLLVSFVGIAVLLFAESALLGLLARLEEKLPFLRRLHLGAFLSSFNQGMAFLRSPAALLRVAAWTLAIWLVAGATYWAALVGTGLSASVAAVIFLMAVTNLGMVVPSGPGYVGYYHYLVVVALAAFGVEASQAFGTALILHGLTFGTVLVVGLVYLWRGHYGVGMLLSSSRHSADDTPPPRPGDVETADRASLGASPPPASEP